KTDCLRAGPRIGDHVDHGRHAGLHSSVGALQGRANLVGFLNVLTVTPKHLGEFIVAGKTKVATGPATHRRPPAVIAPHHPDGNFVPYSSVHLHAVHAEGAIATEHDHLLIRFGHLRSEAIGDRYAHAAIGAGIDAMAWCVGGDRLTRVVENFVPIYHQDGVAVHEVTHFFAQAQGMNRY